MQQALQPFGVYLFTNAGHNHIGLKYPLGALKCDPPLTAVRALDLTQAGDFNASGLTAAQNQAVDGSVLDNLDTLFLCLNQFTRNHVDQVSGVGIRPRQG